MKKLLSILAVVMILSSLTACKKPQSNASDEQIKKYILAHPEVLVESLQNYQRQQTEGGDKKIQEEIKKHTSEIFDDKSSAVIGNPKGTRVMVEFFDYNCHYCKGVLGDIKKVVDEDKEVKVIFKELAFLGPTSAATAVAAIVVHDVEPDKYFAFHTALMDHQGPADNNSIAEAAKKAGIDPAMLEKKMGDKKYEKVLTDNMTLARTLGIDGTPTFIINGRVVRGAAKYENMKEELAKK